MKRRLSRLTAAVGTLLVLVLGAGGYVLSGPPGAARAAPEGIYAVVDGTHYNQWCCFDYGNAQTNNLADEPAIMETVYFGANKQWGYGAGAGPWIMADLEWGLFSGVNAGYNNIASINHRFVTAMVKVNRIIGRSGVATRSPVVSPPTSTDGVPTDTTR